MNGAWYQPNRGLAQRTWSFNVEALAMPLKKMSENFHYSWKFSTPYRVFPWPRRTSSLSLRSRYNKTPFYCNPTPLAPLAPLGVSVNAVTSMKSHSVLMSEPDASETNAISLVMFMMLNQRKLIISMFQTRRNNRLSHQDNTLDIKLSDV